MTPSSERHKPVGPSRITEIFHGDRNERHNFKDGKPVGGSTITESYKAKILAKASEMGWVIE